MKKWQYGRTVLCCLGVVSALFFLLSGCAGTTTKKGASTSEKTASKDKGASPLYYDFGDVLLPAELKVVKKSSFVIRASGFSAGVVSLKGRVDGNSLITFFGNNMAKDNWTEVASFKSPRSMMLFQKANRWCVIDITEKDFNTYVEIWVAPTINEAESGLFK
ncbi:MAG: hypothetical protein JRF27_00095 [Deltaproteobacteria bacterium]|nr:hypothetical protein [Deltaproteobacteria bacterium]MBW2192169.1 hypothetical protein [Deltaproteobacteria bacterium]